MSKDTFRELSMKIIYTKEKIQKQFKDTFRELSVKIYSL